MSWLSTWPPHGAPGERVRLSTPGAALVAAFVACVVYAGTLRNDWALDDHPVIARNPAAQSPGAALAAAFSPYWPAEEDLSAGLYRPFTVLTYGIDWAISGGRPWWFHLVNTLLHGFVSGLVVLVAAAWLAPPAALVSGLVFAVHPVHVEAVANVVGRAELLAAAGLLGAVLAARRYRAASGPARRGWLVMTVVAVAAAELSKEHGVVALALVALDHFLGRDRESRSPRLPTADLYLAVAAVTIGFLHVWRSVSGDLVASAAVVPLRDLTTFERLAEVLPVQLEVLRLLVWPLDLAPEYGPQTIPMREAWSWVAVLGGLASAAIVSLAVLIARRAPAVAFGMLAGAVTYAPTSNLLFVSGVVLAERSLYLAVLAPALVLAWLVAGSEPRVRAAATAAVLVVLGALTVRTVMRVPFWRDTRTVVIEGFISHPESFSAHVRLARALEQTGDVQGAIAQYMTATAIYDGYSFIPVRAARLALASGRLSLARELADFAATRDPRHPAVARLRADVLLRAGEPDSGLAVLRDAIDAQPLNLAALEAYVEMLAAVGAPDWQRRLAAARLEWRRGHPIAATDSLSSSSAGIAATPGSEGECWELNRTAALSQALHGGSYDRIRSALGAGHQLYGTCRITVE